jgi:glutathione synthase/RimK-type ligase-like ATP-grasp enzyme
MAIMALRHVTSKWKKTAVLLRFQHLTKYVPKTVRMTRDSLKLMLQQFQMVYAKPNVGTFGGGVMKVQSLGDGRYRYQLGLTPKSFDSYDKMYSSIERAIRGRYYLVQKGIPLLKHKHRRFDIRVMVQRSPLKQWETTGLIGRAAAKGKIVTNYHNGGTPMAVETLMSEHMSTERKRTFTDDLRKMGVQVAKALSTQYPGIREIGIDVGVDEQFHPWILEVNTRPDPYIFRHLSDKSVVRKVLRYARSYGRVK